MSETLRARKVNLIANALLKVEFSRAANPGYSTTTAALLLSFGSVEFLIHIFDVGNSKILKREGLIAIW